MLLLWLVVLVLGVAYLAHRRTPPAPALGISAAYLILMGVFSHAPGWLLLVFWLLWLAVAGLFTTISMLYVSETALRTRTHNQLSGLAQRYVGSFGAWAIFLSVAVNSIGALIAYMSGSGKILSAFFGISPALGSVLFFIPAAGVLYLGLSAIGKGESRFQLFFSLLKCDKFLLNRIICDLQRFHAVFDLGLTCR